MSDQVTQVIQRRIDMGLSFPYYPSFPYDRVFKRFTENIAGGAAWGQRTSMTGFQCQDAVYGLN